MPTFSVRRAVACVAALSLLCGATASAAATSETTMSVAPRVATAAPAESPATFPGVTSVRAGTRLPRGWVVVGRDVKITRGDEPAYAALRMICPKGKTWRSGTSDGDIDAGVLDRNVSRQRSVLVMATFLTTEVDVGDTASGTVYALCR